MKNMYHDAMGKLLQLFPIAFDRYTNFSLAAVTFIGYMIYLGYINAIYPELFFPPFMPALVTIMFVISTFTSIILTIQLMIIRYVALNHTVRRYKYHEPTK